MNLPRLHSRRKTQAGFTLLEMLVSGLLAAVVMLLVTKSFAQLLQSSGDQKLRTTAQLQAQGVLDMIIPELRMLGNGVPFHQANFLIAQATLTDNTVTQPILVAGTTATQIQFRLNQTGETYILTANFDPALTSTVTLTSVTKMYVGDHVYITNSTVGDDDGYWGVISTINSGAKTATFAAGAQYSPTAVFNKGSLVEVVPIITYSSAADYGGITRNDGSGAVTLVSNGQLQLEYLNSAGTVITLPLLATEADPFPASAIQNIRSIRVTVQVRSSSVMRSGDYYVASAVESVGVRNLNYRY